MTVPLVMKVFLDLAIPFLIGFSIGRIARKKKYKKEAEKLMEITTNHSTDYGWEDDSE